MTQDRFKYCLSCWNLIPDPATVCMYCGAGQQVQKAQKEKKKGGLGKILLWLVVAFFGCIVLAVVGSFFTDDTPTAQRSPASSSSAVVSVPTLTPTPAAPTDVPIPTGTPEPPTPTPPLPTSTPIYIDTGIDYPPVSELTIGEILDHRSQMTDLQYEDYTNSLVGVRMYIIGEVREVYSNGDISIKPNQASTFSGWVRLEGLPKGIGVTLNKDTIIEFDATIRKFEEFLGLTITMYDPVLYRIN